MQPSGHFTSRPHPLTPLHGKALHVCGLRQQGGRAPRVCMLLHVRSAALWVVIQKRDSIKTPTREWLFLFDQPLSVEIKLGYSLSNHRSSCQTEKGREPELLLLILPYSHGGPSQLLLQDPRSYLWPSLDSGSCTDTAAFTPYLHFCFLCDREKGLMFTQLLRNSARMSAMRVYLSGAIQEG